MKSRTLGVLIAALVVVTCGEPGASSLPERVATSIVASHDSVSIVIGDSAQLWVEVRDQDNALLIPDSVSWTSANASIASVSNGKVRGVAEGLTTVTVSHAALQAQVPVHVLPVITETHLSSIGDTL